jgi:uncharacterized membrane protein YfcA
MVKGSKASWAWSLFQALCLGVALTASIYVGRSHRWLGNTLFVIAFGAFVAMFYGRRTDVGRNEAMAFSGIGALGFGILIFVLLHVHDPIVVLAVPGCVFFVAVFLVLVHSKPARNKPGDKLAPVK